jgi:pyrophosphatase PpaX
MRPQGSQTPIESWRAVLFDLDGTLADTVDLILRSFRHTMDAHLGEVPPDARWLETIGRPLRDSLRLFARSSKEASLMAETYVTFQRACHDDLVSHYREVPELLAGLAAADIPLAVVTSKRREMALRTLDRCGLGAYFEHVVCADEVERGKPDPEPVYLAVTRLGVPAGPDVLFVGDSVFDMRAGRAAGVSTGAALWGPIDREVLAVENPDHWLGGPLEVLDLVRPSGAGPQRS